MTVSVGIFAGTRSGAPCRLCDGKPGVVIKSGRAEYLYCESCVDKALERAEVDAAAKSRDQEHTP